MVKIIEGNITITLPNGDREAIMQLKSALFDMLQLAAFNNSGSNSYGDDVYVIIEFIKTLLDGKALKTIDTGIEITMEGRSEDVFNLRNALLNVIRMSGESDGGFKNYEQWIYSATSFLEALMPEWEQLKMIYERN